MFTKDDFFNDTQCKIMVGLIDGKQNKTIAHDLNLSYGYVRNSINEMIAKTCSHDARDMIVKHYKHLIRLHRILVRR